MITQGKWKKVIVEGDHRVLAWDNELAFSTIARCGAGTEDEDNAKFIANAPETLRQRDDLLEACKKYGGHLPNCEKMWKSECTHNTPITCTCGFEQAIADVEVK